MIISIGTSELSLVQVIVQHWYDSPPEVINHKLTLVNSPQILVNESVNLTASVLQNLTISGLSSGTHYIVYCMAVDRGGNDSPIRSLEIVTVSHLPALEVLYPFSQPNITSH